MSVLAALLAAPPLAAQVRWDDVTRSSGSPPSRAEAAFAFDERRGRLVVFGGDDGLTRVDETWEFDTFLSSWRRVTTSGGPAPRSGAVMAWDAARQEIVLFGGLDRAGTARSDTWTYDGTRWQRRAPPTSPPPRHGAAMAFDRARAELVLTAGFQAGGPDLADTWIWDGSTWTERRVGGFAARGAHRMAYDARREQIVAFGGYRSAVGGSIASTLDRTSLWDGTRWTNPTLPSTARPRSARDAALVWDPQRERVLLFGGLHLDPRATPTVLDDTWEWDGARWQRPIAERRPPARFDAWAYADFTRFRGLANRVVITGGDTGFVRRGDRWTLGSVFFAQWDTAGVGCAGSAGVPELDPVVGQPWHGDTFELEIRNAPSTTPLAFVLVGLSSTRAGPFGLPLDLGMLGGVPGCLLRTSPDAVVGVPLANGRGRWTGSFDGSTELRATIGLRVHYQALVPDPSLAAPLPAVLSRQVRAIVGQR